MKRAHVLPGVIGAMLLVQAIYLVYAIAKKETEIFVHRGDGTIADLLAYNEYGSWTTGYRLHRIFRDSCRGCTVEVSGEEGFPAEQLAEVGKVRLVHVEAASCPGTIAGATLEPTARRFDLATDETPFGLFRAKDAKVWRLPVTVVLDSTVTTYRSCRENGADAILPLPTVGSRR